jgi:hypothetical protein
MGRFGIKMEIQAVLLSEYFGWEGLKLEGKQS